MLSHNIFGVTDTDAMDAYHLNGWGRSTCSERHYSRITTAAATTSATTYVHLHNHQWHGASATITTATMMSWHINNNGTWGRGGKKSEEDVARVVAVCFSELGPRVEKKNVCVRTARNR